MYTDPHLYLREHQRRTAQVTTDGIWRLEAARALRPRVVRPGLLTSVAQRVRQLRVHRVAW